MCNGNNQLNMACPFPPDFFLGYFYPATIADDAFVTDTFVFSAMAFIILHRAKDPFAEKSVALWLIGPVIDGFRLQNFSERTFKDGFRRS
jgi:hypothetical protein